MSFTATYDACVLHPAGLRDFLVRLGTTGLFRARWSDDILNEMVCSVLNRYPDLRPSDLERTRKLMCDAVPDCLTTGYDDPVDARSCLRSRWTARCRSATSPPAPRPGSPAGSTRCPRPGGCSRSTGPAPPSWTAGWWSPTRSARWRAPCATRCRRVGASEPSVRRQRNDLGAAAVDGEVRGSELRRDASQVELAEVPPVGDAMAQQSDVQAAGAHGRVAGQETVDKVLDRRDRRCLNRAMRGARRSAT